VHTLDIAPLRSESPPQKRSGMAHVLKGSQFYLHTHTLWVCKGVPFASLESLCPGIWQIDLKGHVTVTKKN